MGATGRMGEKMNANAVMQSHVIAAAIAWVAIILATRVILGGTPYFGQMLPVIGGGAAFFVVILPAGLLRRLAG